MLIRFIILKAIQQLVHTYLHTKRETVPWRFTECSQILPHRITVHLITKIILFSVHINLQNHFAISYKDLVNIIPMITDWRGKVILAILSTVKLIRSEASGHSHNIWLTGENKVPRTLWQNMRPHPCSEPSWTPHPSCEGERGSGLYQLLLLGQIFTSTYFSAML